MTTRRDFLLRSGALALAGAALPAALKANPFFTRKAARPIGLQLYTLGNLMTTDPRGTLEKLAAIGYKELESAVSSKGNFYGYTPKEFSALAKSMGLHWRSAHVSGAGFSPQQILQRAKTAADSARAQQFIDRMKGRPKTPNLTDDYQLLAEQAAEGGLSYLVCASIPVHTLDEIKKAAEVFSKAGEACKKVGVQFAYHNHTTEFDEVEGQRPFDYILSHTDKDRVKMELDLAWATKAGQDPVALFQQHPGRFPLWHVKDLDKQSGRPTMVGSGTIDFKRIFDHAKESGMKYFFVEQDGAPQPIDNVTQSYQFLEKMLKG